MEYDCPTLTTSNVRRLLDSEYEDAVLYVKPGPDSDFDGPPELDVWCRSRVPSRQQIVLEQSAVLDVLGDDPDDDQIENVLPGFQDSVRSAFDWLYPEQDTVDLSDYAEAMHDVASYLLGEYDDAREIDEGAIADQMNDDERFEPLDDDEFLEVRDAIGDLVQSGTVAAGHAQA